MKKQGAKEYIIENYHQLQGLANEIPSSAENYSLLLCVLGEGEVKNDYREVCEQYIQGNTETAATVFEKIKSSFKHHLPPISKERELEITDLFLETEWLLHDQPQRKPEYYKAQIMANAELAFSFILYLVVKEKQFPVTWLDARDVIRASDDFPFGNPDMESNITFIEELLSRENKCIITQGRIAATEENENVLLTENPWKIH